VCAKALRGRRPVRAGRALLLALGATLSPIAASAPASAWPGVAGAPSLAAGPIAPVAADGSPFTDGSPGGRARGRHPGGHGALEVKSITRPDRVVLAKGRARAVALIVSGDGGWQAFEESTARVLARRGIAVVGVDALRYFWAKKEPRQVAADLARLLDAYGAALGTRRYALIGVSFGADIMPEVWPLFPRSVRDQVAVVSLLSLGRYADFEVTIATMLGLRSRESRPLAPVLRQLPLDRTQCLYGREEADASSCTAAEIRRGDVLALEGGHLFNGDSERAAQWVSDRILPPATGP
jgi:pimeloyl-ACP methyl ester carboxylesterase